MNIHLFIIPKKPYGADGSIMVRKKSSLGAMRGIDFDAVIPEPVRTTIEDSEHEDEFEASSPKQSRHATRASRGTVNPTPIYSSKYHPIDEVTRPNSAQVRRRRKAASLATPDQDDDDDDSVVVPSSQTLSDAEDEPESSQDEFVSRKARRLTPRTPNPRSTRHSSRKEANKLVSYSTKHHPQDYALPFHGDKAAMGGDWYTESSFKPSKRKAEQHEAVVHLEDDSSDQIPSNMRQHPRKKLKSLGRGHATSELAARRDRQSKESKAGANSPIHVESDSSDLSEVDDEMISGPQPAYAHSTPVTEDDSSPEHHAVEALDDKNSRLAEFRKQIEALNSEAEDSSVTPAGALPCAAFIPEYVRTRIALSGGDLASLTTATLLEFVLADHRGGSYGELCIHRPYLTPRTSTTEDDSVTPQSAQDPIEDTHPSPYTEGIAPESEFEEQMAITESSERCWNAINTQPSPPESSQLATSDPIRLLMTQPPIADDEDLPSTARPSPVRSIYRNQ